MKRISKADSIRRQNSKDCVAFEYEFSDAAINTAVIELTGRYPESGRAMNTVCTELIYVSEGYGSLNVGDETTLLEKGDMVTIDPKEEYYFDGTMTLLISSSPAWYPEQYRNV